VKAFMSLGVAASVAFGVSAAAPVIANPTWVTANSVSDGDQDVAAIAANRSGHVAVVWEDDRDATAPEDNAHSEIWLRLFKDGNPLYEVKLSGGGSSGVTDWRHLNPDVGLDDAGNAVVVWSDDPDGNGFYNVPYRVVNTSGTVTASGTANSSADGQQINPSVAVDPDGAPSGGAVAFTVAWEDIQGSNPALIKAAGFTGPGTRAWEVTVSQTTGAHHRPDVAVSASGEAVVVWEEDADADGAHNIGLIRLAKATGAATLSRRTANAGTGGQRYRPSVAATFNGEFAAAWESSHSGTPGVWTRSFTRTGAALHAEVEAAAGGTGASIGLDGQGGTVVAWTAAQDVWVRGYNPDGTDTGRLAAQRLTRVAAGKQEGMAVAVSHWGEVSAAYADDNDGNTWDQIYLGMGVVNTGW
jgi:hypothetical protein